MKQSNLIKTIVEGEEEEEEEEKEDNEIPLINVEKEHMIDIIEYCKYYNEKPFEEIEKPIKSEDMEENE